MKTLLTLLALAGSLSAAPYRWTASDTLRRLTHGLFQMVLAIPGGTAAPGGGSNTFTLVQHPINTSGTGCSGVSPCTVTLTQNTGAGHLLVAGLLYDLNTATSISSVTSGACSGSWQIQTSAYDSTSGKGMAWAYCLLSVSGVGSIDIGQTASTFDSVAWIWEASSTTTAALDVLNTVTDNTSCLTSGCTGAPLSGSLSGTNDALIQIAGAGRTLSAVTQGYTCDFASANNGAFCWLLNSTNAVTPGFTVSVDTQLSGVGGAFK